MVVLEKIPFSKLKEAVDIAYEDDIELFDKYHIIKGSCGECVNKTMELIKEVSEYTPMVYYHVVWNGVMIGYVCRFEDVLYSYGLNIAYRRKKILCEWWEEVGILMGGYFKTFLFSNNERARDFLHRNGCKTVAEKDNILTLIKL